MNRLIGTALMFLCALASAQGMTKWIDEKGRVHYGDRPPGDAKEQPIVRGATSSVGGQTKPASRSEAAGGAANKIPGIPPGESSLDAFKRQQAQQAEMTKKFQQTQKDQAPAMAELAEKNRKAMEDQKLLQRRREMLEQAQRNREQCMRAGRSNC